MHFLRVMLLSFTNSGFVLSVWQVHGSGPGETRLTSVSIAAQACTYTKHLLLGTSITISLKKKKPSPHFLGAAPELLLNKLIAVTSLPQFCYLERD